MDHKVYIISCSDYTEVEDRLATLIARMGGIGHFAQPGEEILLKCNLLAPTKPEQAVCTNPAVVSAVAKLVKDAGARAVIGDSPGGFQPKESTLKHLYEKTGMAEAAQASGAELSYDTTCGSVSFPAGVLMKHMEVINPILHADGIINLCKMKTHLFMSMTGAVKNHFGIIPGLAKVGFHASLPDKSQFAQMLLDLSTFTNARLHIMDAVVGLEGEGPGASGTPRQVGLLLASENPLALDVVAGEIMGLPRNLNPVLLAAEERGMTPNRLEDVTLIGGEIADLRIPDYQFPSAVRNDLLDVLGPFRGPIARFCRAVMAQTPKIKNSTCVACGICKTACPAKAIEMSAAGGKAQIDGRKCVRCYCCHELCPQKAVALRKNPLARIFK